jgi:GLPGLI family protein
MRLFLIILFFSATAFALPAPADHPSSAADLTISYSITLRQKKDNAGVGEIYNGGIQTLFAGKHEARLRLASLMRIESVFAVFDNGGLKNITIIKESGSDKHKAVLSPGQWNQYNNKYNGATCHLSEDTIHILKHICKKAVINLRDGRQITAWYYPDGPKPSFSYLLPAFSGIPGIVLKYEYTYKKKTLVYTATSISYEPISADVFTPPGN